MSVPLKGKIIGGFGDAPPPQLASLRHLWRFIFILIGIAAAAFLQGHFTTPGRIGSRIPLYFALIAIEILLTWFVAIGVRPRGYRLRDLLGRRWRSFCDGCNDVILAIGTIVVLRLCTRAIYFFFGRWSSNIGFLLPTTSRESDVWIGVAITAGFCEELVYRGYLQTQFWSLLKNPWSAVALQAVVFGSAHVYQGWKAAAVTAIYGAVFGTLATWRRSIIPGIIAHSIVDIIGGLRL